MSGLLLLVGMAPLKSSDLGDIAGKQKSQRGAPRWLVGPRQIAGITTRQYVIFAVATKRSSHWKTCPVQKPPVSDTFVSQ